MGGTAFDFVRIEVPCPKCGKNDLQRLADLVASDATTCSFCRGTIDLTSHDWRARLAQKAKEFKEIKIEKP